MIELWTHPTAVDVYTTWRSATSVWRLPLNNDASPPLVPKIVSDGSLAVLAGFILALDAIDRLNAYSTIDFSGATLPSCKHIAFATVEQNRSYDVERSLARFIEDGQLNLPSPASNGEFFGELSPWSKVPRGTLGAVLPEMLRAPTGRYSRDAAVRRGLLLNEARAVQQARSAAIDAGLAATCAADWTAARAANLAWLQATFPDRGYT